MLPFGGHLVLPFEGHVRILPEEAGSVPGLRRPLVRYMEFKAR